MTVDVDIVNRLIDLRGRYEELLRDGIDQPAEMTLSFHDGKEGYNIRFLRLFAAGIWEQGNTSGQSFVRRSWSDEPNLEPPVNPYLKPEPLDVG